MVLSGNLDITDGPDVGQSRIRSRQHGVVAIATYPQAATSDLPALRSVLTGRLLRGPVCRATNRYRRRLPGCSVPSPAATKLWSSSFLTVDPCAPLAGQSNNVGVVPSPSLTRGQGGREITTADDSGDVAGLGTIVHRRCQDIITEVIISRERDASTGFILPAVTFREDSPPER